MTRFIRCAQLLLLILATSASFAQQRPEQRPQLPQIPLPSGTRELRDVPYVKGGAKSQSLDLFVPANADKKLPLVIWIHGGGWQGGDKAQNPAIALIRFGYVVVSVNYRLSQEAIFPAQINDCKAAVRWLRAHADEYHIDPDRIGAWGASAGGHLVALLGTAGDAKELEGDEGNEKFSSKVQCVCDFFGPSDLTKIQDENVAGAAIPHLLGGPLHDHLDQAKQASPITYVSKDDPPFLIMQGTNDPLVSPQQSQWLYDALKQAGVEAHIEIIEGAGHGGPQFATPERRKMILQFFDAHLKPSATQPTTKQ